MRNISCNYYNLQNFHTKFLPFYGYLGSMVCIISIFTNVLNVFVLNHKRMKTPTNLILLSLAALDIVTCSVQLPVLIKFYIIDLHVLMGLSPWFNDWGWVFYYLFSSNVSLISHNTSVWLGSALAVFRYHIVRQCTISSILRYRATQEKRRAFTIIFICLIFNILLIIPYLFTQTIQNKVKQQIDSNSSNEHFQYQASRYKKMPILDIYSFWMVSILDKLIPSIIMAVFIGALLHSMARNEERKRSLVFERLSTSNITRKGHKNHHRATRLLVVIVIIILLAEVPHAIMQFMSRLHNNSYCVYIYLGDIMDLLSLCKNSITFVLYCLMSSDFRKIFTYYYMKCRCIQQHRFSWSKNDLEQQSSVNDFCTSIFHHNFQTIPHFINQNRLIQRSTSVPVKETFNLLQDYQTSSIK